MIEIQELRTSHQKTFDLGNGNKRLVASLVPVHYQDNNGAWRDVDMTLVNGQVRTGIYHVDILPNKVGFKATDRTTGKGISVEFLPGPAPTPIITGNQALWRDVIPGVDVKFVFDNSQAHIFRILKTDTATKTATWKIVEDAGDKQIFFNSKVMGLDANKRQTKHTKFYQNGILTDTFEGKVFERDKKTRAKIEVDPVYPVEIDPVIDVFSSANNDGFSLIIKKNGVQTYSNFNTTGLRGYALYNSSLGGSDTYKSRRGSFVRFSGITIPQGSTINSATLKIYEAIGNAYNPRITINAKKLNNPNNPTNANQVIFPATLATHNLVTTISLPDQYVNFNVLAIVQELVSSFDYSNETMLFFIGKSMINYWTLNKIFAHYLADNSGTAKDPELVIDYTSGGGGGYSHKVNSVTPSKVNGVTPSKVNNI
jgi:hypothetical protein